MLCAAAKRLGGSALRSWVLSHWIQLCFSLSAKRAFMFSFEFLRFVLWCCSCQLLAWFEVAKWKKNLVLSPVTVSWRSCLLLFIPYEGLHFLVQYKQNFLSQQTDAFLPGVSANNSVSLTFFPVMPQRCYKGCVLCRIID